MAHQSRGTPSTPDHAWSTAAPAVAGKKPHQDLAQRRHRRRLGPAVVVGPRAEAVRDAPAAQRDPVVGGALGVHVGVRHVAEGLAAGPADGRPTRRSGSGSVAIIEEFIGSQARRCPLQPRGEPLRAAQHVRRADRAVRRDRVLAGGSRSPASTRGSRRPAPRRPRPGPGQLRRVDPRAVRGPGCRRRCRPPGSAPRSRPRPAATRSVSPNATSASWYALQPGQLRGGSRRLRGRRPCGCRRRCPPRPATRIDLVHGLVHRPLEADARPRGRAASRTRSRPAMPL